MSRPTRATPRTHAPGSKGPPRPASAFLDWIVLTHDPGLVPALHAALRGGTYRDTLFEERTGKALAELWREFGQAPRPEFTR